MAEKERQLIWTRKHSLPKTTLSCTISFGRRVCTKFRLWRDCASCSTATQGSASYAGIQTDRTGIKCQEKIWEGVRFTASSCSAIFWAVESEVTRTAAVQAIQNESPPLCHVTARSRNALALLRQPQTSGKEKHQISCFVMTRWQRSERNVGPSYAASTQHRRRRNVPQAVVQNKSMMSKSVVCTLTHRTLYAA
jgi:hypothetical protein